MTGQLTSTFVWLGSDCLAHMAEEVQDAALVVPQSMVLGYLINGPLGLAMALTLVFSHGPMASAPKHSAYPFVWLFHRAFQNTSATTTFVSVVLFLLGATTVSVRAVSSRVTLVRLAHTNLMTLVLKVLTWDYRLLRALLHQHVQTGADTGKARQWAPFLTMASPPEQDPASASACRCSVRLPDDRPISAQSG
jgi:amino acid transporter